jgi:hypothetical protein
MTAASFSQEADMSDSLTAQMKAEEGERAALSREDYAAAGVDCPDWDKDPIPSLETWRRWQSAQDKALAHKRAAARVGP